MDPLRDTGAPDESFEQAVLRFQDFLTRHGHSPNVIWIKPSDVVLAADKRIFLYHSEQESAENAARNVFNQAIGDGNGVVLKGLFPKEHATYSFIWFPCDRAEAEYGMVPRGVKLQVNISEAFKVVVVRSRERWQALSRRHASMQFMTTDLFH